MFFLKHDKSTDSLNNSLEGSVAEIGLEIDIKCCGSKEWEIERGITPSQC